MLRNLKLCLLIFTLKYQHRTHLNTACIMYDTAIQPYPHRQASQQSATAI